MSKKLYVGGLPYAFTDKELQELFSQTGTVDSANIVIDKFSGRSRGFGFVEMSTEEEAQKAIQALNGMEVGGRTITVNEARPMSGRSNRGFGRRQPRG